MADHVVERRHPRADADRVVVGDQRLVHRDRVGLGDAGEEARPEQHEGVDREAGEEHEEAEEQRSRRRRSGRACTRSASQPIGTAPSTKNAADAVLMNTIVPSLMPNVCRISGASTLIAAPSSSSKRVEQREDDEHAARRRPAKPSREQIGSELTPGSRSSGKMTCSRARRLRVLARRFLVEDCGRERGGVAARASSASARPPAVGCARIVHAT